MLGHVVISGETNWFPTRIVHLGRSNMVDRTLGAVYLYAPGQTICMTYGSITESGTLLATERLKSTGASGKTALIPYGEPSEAFRR